MTEQISEELIPKPKFAKAAFMNLQSNITVDNPWSWEDVDKLDILDLDEYKTAIKACRFFYKHDPIGSSILNKMIDIGITALDFERVNLKNNEEKIVEGLLEPFLEFAEAMALEFLITGLVVPEISYSVVDKDVLKSLGVKKYNSMTLPTSMWLRDPETIEIKAVISDMPTYFVKISDEIAMFIMNNGKYMDGTSDPDLWFFLQTYYPGFIEAVKNGVRKFRLQNPLIIRRRPLSNSPYPIPYLYNAVESMKHKRNIRRMDYSIASRVISAIQLFKLGSDEFPLTEDDQYQLDELKNQMFWRNTSGTDIERIFQLFAPHTLSVEWVFPDVNALLNEEKYKDVNRDIFYALGFPAILVTGETERSGSSNPEYAMMSPVKTMENFRAKILKVLNSVLKETFDRNNLPGDTVLRFTPINLNSFRFFNEAITKLYETGNISRTSYVRAFGYNLEDEFELKEEEEKMIESMDLPEFAPQPFSPQPQGGSQNPQNKPTPKPKSPPKE